MHLHKELLGQRDIHTALGTPRCLASRGLYSPSSNQPLPIYPQSASKLGSKKAFVTPPSAALQPGPQMQGNPLNVHWEQGPARLAPYKPRAKRPPSRSGWAGQDSLLKR